MKWKNVLLGAVVFGVIASLLGPSVFAAPKAESAKAMSMLDPFTLRTVAMGSGPAGTPAEAKVTLARRPDIRVPFRPGLRSA
ncbi:MAG: hypothetical protein ACYTAS_09160, partial [Planctomycetota bacterium]